MERTEREKMIAGELYLASDPELVQRRTRARRLFQQFNSTAADAVEQRAAILRELVGRMGNMVHVEPPFYCDYGTQISMGDGVYLNMNCIILDPVPVAIGKQAFFGPGVQLLTATHPLDAAVRAAGPEYGRAITIGPRVWLGGGVIVCPGVTIGEDTTIGAGSVVTRDIPPGVVAAGNPCRVLRTISAS